MSRINTSLQFVENVKGENEDMKSFFLTMNPKVKLDCEYAARLCRGISCCHHGIYMGKSLIWLDGNILTNHSFEHKS